MEIQAGKKVGCQLRGLICLGLWITFLPIALRYQGNLQQLKKKSFGILKTATLYSIIFFLFIIDLVTWDMV